MPDTEKKLAVLSQIAERFQEARLLWAVGGSVLLYLKGKTDSFHDLDLMVGEADAARARDILLEMGTLLPQKPTSQYRTRTFLEFVVDEVDIDVMAGFVIVRDGEAYDCALLPEQIVETVPFRGVPVPLQSLALWKRYYALMGRTEKVKMIE